MGTAMKRLSVYLGLVDDEEQYGHDGYDYVDDRSSVTEDERPQPVAATSAPRLATVDSPAAVPAVRPAAPVPPVDSGIIHTIHPRSYNDARRIGIEFRQGSPVIMNLGEMDDNDAKRIVDFAAGLVFATEGSMERVTKKVFLLSPANVDVRDAPAVRQARDGFYNQS